jgi:hypothetical protein
LRNNQLDDHQLKANRLAEHSSVSETAFPNDPEPSIQYTPPGEHRPQYRCGCTRRNAQGQKEQGSYPVFADVRGLTFGGLNDHSQKVMRRYPIGPRRFLRGVCHPRRLSASARGESQCQSNLSNDDDTDLALAFRTQSDSQLPSIPRFWFTMTHNSVNLAACHLIEASRSDSAQPLSNSLVTFQPHREITQTLSLPSPKPHSNRLFLDRTRSLFLRSPRTIYTCYSKLE